MNYGSVCSGIEAASLAWEPLGMQPSWFAEIEKFPCKVLAHRWPAVPNPGDMTMLPQLISMGAVEAPNILVGGTPCQSFSVAGLRAGMADPRGQLTHTYVQIADAVDDARGVGDECITVWENVPGVLSDKTNGFGCLLAGLVGEDEPLQPSGKRWTNAGCVYGPKRTAAWRILDAQYFGVAQRRRRVFVVASANKRVNPCKILFESEGVRRDTPPSRETGQEVADPVTQRPYNDRGSDNITALALLAKGGTGRLNPSCENLITHTLTNRYDSSEDGCGRGAPLIAFHSNARSDEMKFDMHSLTKSQTAAVAFQPRIGRNGRGYAEDVFPALNGADSGETSDSRPCVAYPIDTQNMGEGNSNIFAFDTTQITSPLNYSNPKPGDPCHPLATKAHVPAIAYGYAVRRLLPIECERLQGMPDNHTNIPGAADGPRYKAIGNSFAVPVVRWIGKRILATIGDIK